MKATCLLLLILLINCCRPAGDRVYVYPETEQTDVTDSTSLPHNYILSINIPETNKEYIDIALKVYTDKLKQEFLDIANKEVESVAKYQLNITTQSFRLAPGFESYKLDIYEYTGGAHGNTFYKTFTFDLREQREVSAYEVYKEFVTDEQSFYKIVSDVVMSTLAEQLTDKDWIEQGTGTDPKNYENFVVTDDGITFFFPPYQVASYADGSFNVLVDWMVFQ